MPFLLMLLIVLGGCELADKAFQRPVELQEAADVEMLEEQILREFFNTDFAQRKVAHLALQTDIQDFAAVINPRPRISDVIAEFGEADNVIEEDLVHFGVRRQGQVYYFGRLRLITQVGGDEIFWVLIE